jgi:hypothetical protein
VDRAYAIIDDFLSPQEHQALWDAFQETIVPPADTREWNRVYQLTDGEERVDSKYAARRPSLRDATPSASPGPPALRLFSEKLSMLLTGDQPPISVERWTDFSASPWVYRAGAGLEWHADTGRVAAYIYYVHPVWRSAWGGELLVATDDGSSSVTMASSQPEKRDVEAVCTTGGVFVYPRPNRLVLLRGGILHCVKKVERAAGEAFRASVSGFFFNTDKSSG